MAPPVPRSESPVVFDASAGEGGGQVLRTSLALSLLTGRPLELTRIRARRSRPGLRAQHLSCVAAAAAVGEAEVEGAQLGSATLRFRPRALRAVELDLDLGTAGSTLLVAQTVLPALLRAPGTSRLRLRGGTHNPLAPSFEFVERVYLPWLRRLGARAEARLERPGFYPRGGGRVALELTPGALAPFELHERGAAGETRLEVYAPGLPEHVATRELRAASEALGLASSCGRVVPARREHGPGNALLIDLEFAAAREVITSYGAKGRSAEAVAAEAADAARAYLAHGAPVGEHGADQLVLLLAIAGGGSFTTGPLSGHTRTQLELIPRFLPVGCLTSEPAPGQVRVELRPQPVRHLDGPQSD